MSRRVVLRGLEAAALVLVLGAVAYCSWFRATGGQWERVETPSMGTTAPVGTLVWARPVAPGDLRAGAVVTFHAPTRPDVYTHRVTEVHDDGTFSTAGDLSGPDDWRVPEANVIGQAQWIWPGAGRVVEAAPVLVVGAVATWGLVLLLRRRQALSVAVLGTAVTCAVAIVVFHPLTDAEQLGFAPEGESGARATYVGTGLLPVRLSAPRDHDSVVLRAGESGSVLATAAANRRLEVRLEPAVPTWFWVVLVGLCFVPALTTVAVGRRPPQ